jgi:hypothetical protein
MLKLIFYVGAHVCIGVKCIAAIRLIDLKKTSINDIKLQQRFAEFLAGGAEQDSFARDFEIVFSGDFHQ